MTRFSNDNVWRKNESKLRLLSDVSKIDSSRHVKLILSCRFIKNDADSNLLIKCFVVVKTIFDSFYNCQRALRHVKVEWDIINIVHINLFIIRHLDANRAYVVENLIHRLMIDVQSNVDIKTSFHVFRVFVKQMKIDVK
jgi:hypothetical protein